MKEKIIKLRSEGKTYNEIKQILGCAKSTISYHCSKMNAISKDTEQFIDIENMLENDFKYFNISDKNVEEIIKLRNDKKSYGEICKKLEISKYIVRKVCTVLNLTQVRKYGRISEETINEMNELYNDGISSLKVAEMLGVSKCTVLKYVNVRRKKKVSEDEKKKKKVINVINWRKRKKIELVEYKGGKCIKCGYDKCVNSLEFHHIDPTKKDFTISGKSWSIERLKKEADKCILVCSNCHKEIHEKLY